MEINLENIGHLTLGCAECAATLTALIVGSPEYYDEDKASDYVLESFGFILAFLHYSDGINQREAEECIACFVTYVYGGNIERCTQAAKVADFYSRVLYEYKYKNEDHLKYSIILYNLNHPQRWDDFSNRFHLDRLDGFNTMEGIVKLCIFLEECLPSKINPILDTFDK